MNKCYIIGGGFFDGFYNDVNLDDIVIAADKGYEYALDYGLEPNYVIGDFDSAKEPSLENVIKLNPIKDYTDTKAAMMIAKEKGYKEIIIYGGLGGRDSHTIANIRNALEFKKMGIDVILKTSKKEIRIVDDSYSYKCGVDDDDFYVSVFALSEVCHGVNLKGLYYELNNYDMRLDDALGVSNETCRRDFTISVDKGFLLVILESKDI